MPDFLLNMCPCSSAEGNIGLTLTRARGKSPRWLNGIPSGQHKIQPHILEIPDGRFL